MYKNNEKTLIDKKVQEILESPDNQLKIIQHFYPEAVNGNKMFKTHDENTPSSILKLDGSKYWLKNFGTGDIAMDCINIIEEKRNCSFTDAVSYAHSQILNTNGNSLNKKNSFGKFDKMVYAIKKNPKQEAKNYLVSRGINTEAILGDFYFQSFDALGNPEGIVFIDSNAKLVNKRFFNPTNRANRYKNSGELVNTLYTAAFKTELDTAFLVEGVINALSLIDYSSLAIFSSDNRINDVDLLKKYLVGKHLIIAFENDLGGNKCAEYFRNFFIENNITEKTIKRLILPEKTDINNLLNTGILSDFLSNPENYKQLYPEATSDSSDVKLALQNQGFYIANNCYYVGYFDKDQIKKKLISNFTLESLYFLPDGSDDAKRVFRLSKSDGIHDLITISAKNLNLKGLKSAILSKGNYSFRGTAADFDTILVKALVNEVKAIYIDELGFNSIWNLYFFSNGLLDTNGKFFKSDKFGIVNLKNNNFFLPAFSLINEDSILFQNDKKFLFRPGNLDFLNWAKLYHQAYQEEGIIGICYLIATIYRDIVYKYLEFFPFIYLFGDFGTGKTKYSEIALNIFGQRIKGVSLEAGSTSKSIARAINKYNNSIIYLKEFDPTSENNIQGFLKTAYEGVGYSRAQTTNDNQTHDTVVNTGIIIDGNHLPSKSSALFSRMILLNFRNQKFSPEQIHAYNLLMEQFDHGFGKVIADVISQRKHFNENFVKNFEAIIRQLKHTEKRISGFKQRALNHLSFLLALFKSMEEVLKFPVLYDEYYEIVLNNALNQFEIQEQISEINQFWSVIELLILDKTLKKDIDYKVFSRESTMILAINFNIVFHHYKANSIKYHSEFTERNTLLALLKNSHPFVPSWQEGRSSTITIKNFGSAYAFNLNKLTLNI